MRDKSDRYKVSTQRGPRRPKRLGGYLIEAGLLTTDQVDVALNDQQATGMRFGEVLVARGWLKEQTVEWIVSRVAKPERQAYARWEKEQATLAQERTLRQPHVIRQGLSQTPAGRPAADSTKKKVAASDTSSTDFKRRDAPISKPLPPINSSDSDVSWVG